VVWILTPAGATELCSWEDTLSQCLFPLLGSAGYLSPDVHHFYHDSLHCNSKCLIVKSTININNCDCLA